MLEVLEQVAGEPELGRGDGLTARELEAERGLSVVEHEAVVLGELGAGLAGAKGRELAVRDDRQLEHVARMRRDGCRAARRPPGPMRRRGPASSRRGRRESRAERARRVLRAPRRRAARAPRSRARRAQAARSRAVAATAFVSAMNGTSYGTVTRAGKSSFSASSASASGGSAQPKPTPNAESGQSVSRKAADVVLRAVAVESWPTPSPVVISNSPPSSHGVGSDSSETSGPSEITFAAPVAPAARLQPEPRQRCDLSDSEHRARRTAWTRGPRHPALRRVGRTRASFVVFTLATSARVPGRMSKPHRGRSPGRLLRVEAAAAGENRSVSLRERTGSR